MDNNSTKHSAQLPHFDWRTSLKAMIYLDDCNKPDQGGLYYIPKSHISNHDKLSLKRIKGEYPGFLNPEKYFLQSDLKTNQFLYCGDLKGSILFFNTDGFHYQGKNRRNKFNRIVRLHSYIGDIGDVHELNIIKKLKR